MVFDPKIHHRSTLRLPCYDYSYPGAYFVTSCAQNKKFYFLPRRVKRMIRRWWEKLPGKFPTVELDEFTIMPNRVHGILLLTEAPDGRPRGAAPTDPFEDYGPAAVGEIIGWFKTMTTNEYISRVKNGDYAPFDKRLWQRNYYERILRNEVELYCAREYISNNWCQWRLDRENPYRTGSNAAEKQLFEQRAKVGGYVE